MISVIGNIKKGKESGRSMSENLLASFWAWARNAFTDSYQEEVRKYLAESVDYNDLERRVKLLKLRGLF